MILVLSRLLPLSGSSFFLFITIFFCFVSLDLKAQAQFKTYTAKKSETISSIAKKIQITREHLLRLNPDLKEGVSQGDILILPAFTKKKKERKESDVITYVVKPHETFFSIAATYKTSEEVLKNLNPSYAEVGLQAGDEIKVPYTEENPKESDESQEKYFYHIVMPKETIWRICYKLGIVRSQLLKYNPRLESGLKVNDTLMIPRDIIDPIENYHFHKVRSNESVASIAAYYAVSQERIKQINKNLKYGIRPQMILKIPKHPEDQVDFSEISFVAADLVSKTDKKTVDTLKYSKEIPSVVATQPTQPAIAQGVITYKNIDTPLVAKMKNKEGSQSALVHPPYLIKKEIYTENARKPFSYKVQNKRIKIAFMLPFYLDEYVSEGFSQMKKKSHDFALHFYSGALMAMVELSNQSTGLHIEAKIYNTEGKNSLAVKSMLVEQDSFLVNSGAVIGPLYTSNAEYIAQKLKRNNIPVVSPFSRKHNLSSGPSNLIQRHVSNTSLQGNMLRYVYENYRDQNIILVGKYEDVDLAGYIKEQLKARVPEENIKLLLSFSENSFKPYEYDSLANYYKENWYLLATNDDVIVTDIINGLYNLKDSLVCSVFAPHYSKVFDKLELRYLSKVNFHYPKDRFIDLDNPKVKFFMKNYIAKYGREPGKYAFMGYDLTYDTALRLANYPSFYHSLSTKMREGLGNRFYYKRYDGGMLYNAASYVVSYDEDMEAISE